ncbi:MAG: chromosome segregation protein SMC [Acidobacteriota bacterium]
MLKLHSLDISGFKSFLEPVKLRFADGITAIVGPNGCGKSNLTDAISWVLGEQSAKTLRGAKMQDIIFNGSAQRKPVGAAEVSLTLATDPSYPRSVDGKITIGRQVFRTGESRYRLNGKVVRLKEIKDLLMDTGLGIRAYSVIEQGKIGMILSGKPQERRKLLEEAAGITRYKARKRVAEVKLEETMANLLRLDDIISEVDRSLRSLKRQASAARRYKAKQAEYQDLLKQVLLGRWSLMKSRLDELEQRLATRLDGESELAAALAKGEAELTAGRGHLDELAAVLGERHRTLANLAATIEGRQEFLKGSRQRRVEMEERLTLGRDQAEERKRQSDEFAKSLGSLDERTREVLAERDEAARLVSEDEHHIEIAQKDVVAAEARLEGLRQELMTSVAGLNTQRATLQRQVVEIEKQTFRLRFLDDERERLDRSLGEAENTLTGVLEKVEAAQGRLSETEAKHGRLTADLDAVLRREAELTEERQQLDTHLAGLRQRQRILVQLSEEHEERRRSLVSAFAGIGIDEPRFLADSLQPAQGWEDGIDSFLGDLADAVVLGPEQSALDVARALAAANVAGVVLRPLTDGAPLPEVEDEALAYSLAEALDLPDDLARALPPAFLVGDAEDAERLAAQHPGIAFLSRGRLWAQGGMLRVEGEEAAPGVLARESELAAIRDEIPQVETRLTQVRGTLATLVEERTRLASEIHRADEERSELRREIAVAQARRQDAEVRRDRVRNEHATVAAEQEELRAAVAAGDVEKARLEDALSQLEAAHEALNGTFDRSQGEVDAAKERREVLRTEGAGRRGRLELLEERLESHHHETSRMQRQITYTEEQLSLWANEDDALVRRIRELEHGMDSAESELQGALEQRVEAESAVLEQQESLDRRREEIRALEGQVGDVRERRDVLRGDIESLRVDRASARQDAEHLSLTFRDAFRKLLPGTAPPPVDDGSEPTDGDGKAEDAESRDAETVGAVAQDASAAADQDQGQPEASESAEGDGEDTPEGEATPEVLEEDDTPLPELTRHELADLEGELARCKGVLDRLGPVNVLAAEEYDEQDERRGFLGVQRKDVADSVASLRATIQEINETSAERFKATFEAVNKAFGETFYNLFRGGEAEMRLFDEEDLLETGIEIIARPPGKRPQNISLLSGGEKALTAIALLFALFETKPSPFCILDEVDAPLDDVNVLRFVDLLKNNRRLGTQFLVVTHNKLTMEVAHTLYGVTMEEKGVSKLVQAEMAALHPADEPAAISA